jgi:AcrR family transcriptional regulator
MGVQERRERERDQTRTKIMDAARDLFATEGFEAVSMRRIAEAIEYSPTAIYVHFKDKQDLFRQLCREDFGRLAGAFLELARVKDPVERILRIGQNYIRFALAYPNHYRLMFMTPSAPPPDEQALGHKGNPDEDAYAMLKQAVTEAIEGRRFRPEYRDSELSTQVCWATAHGVASLQITKGCDSWVDWRPIEARSAAALSAIVRGMLADPSELPAAPRASRKAGAK